MLLLLIVRIVDTIPSVDTTAPTIISCPQDINQDVELGIKHTSVNWRIPSASDVSNNVTLRSQTHNHGDSFAPGRTTVTYTFVDGSNNEATCSFDVFINEGELTFPC